MLFSFIFFLEKKSSWQKKSRYYKLWTARNLAVLFFFLIYKYVYIISYCLLVDIQKPVEIIEKKIMASYCNTCTHAIECMTIYIAGNQRSCCTRVASGVPTMHDWTLTISNLQMVSWFSKITIINLFWISHFQQNIKTLKWNALWRLTQLMHVI